MTIKEFIEKWKGKGNEKQDTHDFWDRRRLRGRTHEDVSGVDKGEIKWRGQEKTA